MKFNAAGVNSHGAPPGMRSRKDDFFDIGARVLPAPECLVDAQPVRRAPGANILQ